jgi:hypothetical protein
MLGESFVFVYSLNAVLRSRIIFMRLRIRLRVKILLQAPAAPAPTLLYSKENFLKRTKV